MARKSKSETPAPDHQKKPISSPPPPPPEPEEEPTVDAEVEDEPNEDGSLTPEQREQKRLARKPNIDHLPDGTVMLDDGSILPLFDVGDRIVVERLASCLIGLPWLDTRVYLVQRINDDTGQVDCIDPEFHHYACVGFKSPHQRFKLAPKKGNPFAAPKKVQPPKQELAPGEKKRRGRPKGSKNRPKEIIQQERQARKEGKAA